jgi:Domain of unknown function (DUF4136)
MKISCLLLATGILNLMPLASMAQEVVPYVKSEVKVDWVPGTDFSKYKTYAWGTTYQVTTDPKHPTEDIDAALQAKGLQKVAMDANPDLIAAFSGGNRLVWPIRSSYSMGSVTKQGTLVVQLADSQLKKAVWWGIAEDTITDNPDKDIPLFQKRISKMFQKYPPPTKKK